MRSVPVFQAVAGFSPFFADCPPFLRAPLFFHFFFPAIFRYRHALQCAKAMILAAQAPAISPHSFLFRNRSVDGCFSSAIRANHCFFLLFRPTPSPSVARRLRRCAGALHRAHGSVLCTLLCGPPRFASWASGLRYCFAVSSPLGASHPFFGLPPALRRVAGFAAALPRLTSESACVFRSQFSAEPFRRFSAFGV